MFNELDRNCDIFVDKRRDNPTADTLNEVGSFLVKGGQCLKDLGYEFLLTAEIIDDYKDTVNDIFAALAIALDYEAAKRECGIDLN